MARVKNVAGNCINFIDRRVSYRAVPGFLSNPVSCSGLSTIRIAHGTPSIVPTTTGHVCVVAKSAPPTVNTYSRDEQLKRSDFSFSSNLPDRNGNGISS